MLKLGIVDFDTSHAVEFTRRFNHVDVDSDQFVEGARVELGWPGSSHMAPERIEIHRPIVARCGVEIVDSPDAMIGRVDAVLIHSLAGDAHRERARPFLDAGLPTFVDKPFACGVADARAMIDLARERGAMLFSSSALPFADEILDFARREALLGPILGCVTYGPDHQAAGNPGLFHYGVHAVSILYALMGPGCTAVSSMNGEHGQTATGRWSDGRLGTVRCGRTGATAYGFIAYCERGVWPQAVSTRFAYRNLCLAIVASLRDRKPAIDPEIALEITRFIVAAHASAAAAGVEIRLETLN